MSRRDETQTDSSWLDFEQEKISEAVTGNRMVTLEKQGDGMNLYIAEITRDQMIRLEKASAFWGKFYWRNSLQKIWYFDTEKMRAVFGVNSFRQMKTGNHRYLGPVLTRRSELDAFLAGIQLYQDDERIDIDSAKIRTRFCPAPQLPPLTDTNVVVFHGEYYRGTTAYAIQCDEPFSLKQLRLNLVECGENGFILQSVSYRGRSSFGKETAQTREYLKPQFVVK
ncbi:MAG: hypothetical protein P8X96_11190 [Desulfobacteraceae bacterium]